jgi:hypothetical protein
MKRIALTAIVFLAFVASVAQAEVKTLSAAKVTIDTPAGWKVEAQGENYSMVGPNEEVAFVVQTFDAANAQQGLANADAYVNKIATDIKWAQPKPQAAKTNGMDSLVNKGQGKVAGKDTSIAVLAVKTPGNKILLMVGMVDSTKMKQYTPTLQKFIDSIKPIP